jgi:hypothetical protein
VLQAIRRYVSGPAGQEFVWRDFARRFAPGHRQLMAAIEGFLRATAAGASRTLRHHPPCRWTLTADEAALLRFLAAAQRGERRRAAWHGGDFLRADAVDAVTHAAVGFGQALLAGGLVLDAEPPTDAEIAAGALAAAVCPLA